jgi:S-adenosylmethionine-diacylgycerolhomoserine-N-methlytransferase
MTVTSAGVESSVAPIAPDQEVASLKGYYVLHSKIYDLTRWSFLFGRDAIWSHLPAEESPRSILEIGCGTGRVLEVAARRFPNARIVGVDLSSDMLGVARRKLARFGERVTLANHAYESPIAADHGIDGGFDLVVTSYALTMFQDGYAAAIDVAAEDLRPGGRFATADFHDTRWTAFRRWMGVNHVRMEGHLLPKLEATFETETLHLKRAYGGVWRWIEYLGRRAAFGREQEIR